MSSDIYDKISDIREILSRHYVSVECYAEVDEILNEIEKEIMEME